MKPIIYILFFLLMGCSKENLMEVKFRGVYAYPEYTYAGERLEIDVNGESLVLDIHPILGGIESETFFVPEGWNEVTRAQIFEGERLVYYVKRIEQLGELNGMVATGVPMVSKGDITLQIFRD